MVLHILRFTTEDWKAWIVVKETKEERDPKTGRKVRWYDPDEVDEKDPFATGGGVEIMRLEPTEELHNWTVRHADRIEAGDVNVFLEYKRKYQKDS